MAPVEGSFPAGSFIDGKLTDASEVASIAGSFVTVTGVLQLFDGMQSVAVGLSRRLRESYASMLLAIRSYGII